MFHYLISIDRVFRRWSPTSAILIACISILVSGCREEVVEKTLTACQEEINKIPINQLQYLGTHNSYHKRMNPELYDFLNSVLPLIPPEFNPNYIDYEHPSLTEQLAIHGLRTLELDVYHDPEGGRFSNYYGLQFLSEDVASQVPELDEPGYKIIHLPDFDYNTTNITLKDALSEIKSWSALNPMHLPVFIMIELKTETAGEVVGSMFPNFTFSSALPFTSGALDSLEMEIVEVFGTDHPQLTIPDEIRGSHPDLKTALAARGWPLVEEMRGQIFLVLNTSNSVYDLYLAGHPHLQGRMIFIFSDPEDPEAAFIQADNPLGNEADIQSAVAQGNIVRSRTDADTEEARTNDYTRRDAAFSSGAQFLSTDYFRPDQRATDPSSGFTNYAVSFDGGVYVRINPVNGPVLITCDPQ